MTTDPLATKERRKVGSMTFDIKLADRVIRIHAMHDYIIEYCRDYVLFTQGETNEEFPVDFEVTVTRSDIDSERDKSAAEDIKEGIPIRHFTDEYLETLAVYRKIAEQMLSYDTILFHGSVIAVEGEGYLFTAKSGTGKSTHARLWRETFGNRAVMVNDDKPLLRITKDGVIAYGTPWDGKHRLSSNTSVPLKGICILERAAKNHIIRLDSKEQLRGAYPMMVQQTHKSSHPASALKTMELIDRLMEAVPIYRLSCNMESEAAKVAYEGMQG